MVTTAGFGMFHEQGPKPPVKTTETTIETKNHTKEM